MAQPRGVRSAGIGDVREYGRTKYFGSRIYPNRHGADRAEAFNIPNHSNPCGQVAGNIGAVVCPVVTLTNSSFGKIQSFGDPRILQLALKYVF